MFLAWTCACVSVVRSPPSPSFLSLSPSRISLSSPPPSFCVFPALLSLLAVSGEQQRLHYRQGERVLPLLTHKHTHSYNTQLQCTVEITRGACHNHSAVNWCLSVVITRSSVVQADAAERKVRWWIVWQQLCDPVFNLLRTSEVTVAHLVRLVCCVFSLFLVSDFLSKTNVEVDPQACLSQGSV